MMFTSCPECSRQFRVRARQLAAAEGLVQCGYCGKQFNALDRLYDKPLVVDTPVSPATHASAPAPAAPLKDQVQQDAIPVSREMPAAEPLVSPPQEEEPEFEIPEDEVTGKSPPAFLPVEEPGDDIINFDVSETENAIKDTGLSEDDLPGDEEEVVSALLNDSMPPGITSASEEETGEEEKIEDDDPQGHDAIAVEPVIAEAAEPEYEFPEELIEAEESRAGWVSRLLWTLGVLLLLSAGAAQAAWFNRDMLLSRYPELLPYAKRICQEFQCTLIRNRNISAIKLVNRDVRVHPRYEDALLVNATITNLSKYTQRFPTVLLTLYDPNGDIMGYRKIPPGDYLDESIDIESGMASNAPIHFVFEVANETRDAVSFEFDFL